MYGQFFDGADGVLNRIIDEVKPFWPDLTEDNLKFGADDDAVIASLATLQPVFVLLANDANDERAAFVVHPGGAMRARLLNKDTMSEEWGEFVSAEQKVAEEYGY